MTRQEVFKSLSVGYAFYPHLALSAPVVDAWLSLFKACDAEVFHKSLMGCIMGPNSRFFPTPGDVRNELIRLTQPAIARATGDEIWQRLVALASQGTSFDQVEAELDGNRAAQIALRSVSWEAIRYANIETQLPFVKRDFLRAYSEISEADQADERLALPGTELKLLGGENANTH